MNQLLRLLGYRDRKYRGAGFSVRIEPIFREAVRIIYTSDEKVRDFGGEYIGRRGIHIAIPQEIDPSRAKTIATRLVEALRALGYGYMIAHALDVETVSDNERQNAIAELRQMGYEVELLPNGAIRQTKLPGSPKSPLEELNKQAPRMMQLIQAVSGKRRRSEILAKSEEF